MSEPTDSKICEEKSETNVKEPEVASSTEKCPSSCESLRVFKINDRAITPVSTSDSQSAYFLFSPDKHIVKSGQNLLIQTHVQITPPPETYVRLTSIHQTAVDNNILVGAGVVDQDYTGWLF